jgi:ribonuclease-3
LTLYKIALVRAENLAEVAKDIGLDKVILLGNGEERNNGRDKTTILCDCLEAVL